MSGTRARLIPIHKHALRQISARTQRRCAFVEPTGPLRRVSRLRAYGHAHGPRSRRVGAGLWAGDDPLVDADLWLTLSPFLTDEQERMISWLLMGSYVVALGVVLLRARRKADQGPSS